MRLQLLCNQGMPVRSARHHTSTAKPGGPSKTRLLIVFLTQRFATFTCVVKSPRRVLIDSIFTTPRRVSVDEQYWSPCHPKYLRIMRPELRLC